MVLEYQKARSVFGAQILNCRQNRLPVLLKEGDGAAKGRQVSARLKKAEENKGCLGFARLV